MKRFKKRTSATRNIVLLILLMGVLGVMIVGVQFLRREPIFILPEVREEIAARRAAPENAFPDLHDIAERYQQNRNVFASGMGLRFPGPAIQDRPNETPEARAKRLAEDPEAQRIDEAWKKSNDAIAEAREILSQKTDYLFPQPNSFMTMFGMRLEAPIQALGEGLMSILSDNPDENIAWSMDAIRLSRLAAGEFRFYDTFPKLEEQALGQLLIMARRVEDRGVMDRIQEAIEAIGPPYPEPRKNLETWWRFLDDTLVAPMPFYSREVGPRVAIRFMLWRLQAQMIEIAREKEKWYALAEMRPSEAAKMLQSEQPRTRGPAWRREFTVPFQMISLVNKMAQARAVYYAHLQAIALLRHHRDEGVYPDSLDALTPRYLAELPRDPFADAPFCYQKTEAGCTIYSRSENATDNGGHQRRDTAIIVLESALPDNTRSFRFGPA